MSPLNSPRRVNSPEKIDSLPKPSIQTQIRNISKISNFNKGATLEPNKNKLKSQIKVAI